MLNGLGNRTVLRVAGNTMSVLTSDVLNRATTFLIYALVSRYLDARAFGQLSLALTLLYLFQVFAVLGLPVLLTREVARSAGAAAACFVHGSLLALAGSMVSVAALGLFLWWVGYDADTVVIILLTAGGLVPYALSNVCESVFRGWESMRYIAYANVPINIAKVALSYVLLERGAGLRGVVLVLAGSYLAVWLIEAALTVRGIGAGRWSLDPGFAGNLARAAVPFFGLESLLTISSSLSVLLISRMVDVASVGRFNAAAQLLVPLAMFTQSVATCVFPLLCRKFDGDAQGGVVPHGDLRQTMNGLIDVLLVVTVPGAIALFYLAEPVLVFVYGKTEFAEAAILLQIMVPMVVLRALTAALGNMLLAGLKEKITLRIATVDTVAALVLGIVLIHYFGVVGAAVAALLTRIVDFVQHYGPAKRLVSRVEFGKLSWPCIVASLAMVGILAEAMPLGLLPAMAAGAAAYFVVLIPLCAWGLGGLRHAFARNP